MRVSWNPVDDRLLASGSSDTTVHIWKLSEAVEMTNHNLGHAGCKHIATLKVHPFFFSVNVWKPVVLFPVFCGVPYQ